jgi:hypothetical protein
VQRLVRHRRIEDEDAVRDRRIAMHEVSALCHQQESSKHSSACRGRSARAIMDAILLLYC